MKVLVVEDNPADACMVQALLGTNAGTSTCIAGTLGDAIDTLTERSFDAILLDLGLPDSLGLETISRVQASAVDTPMVVLTGNDDRGRALEAVSRGAQDYLFKNELDAPSLRRSLRYAIERAKTRLALKRSETRFRSLYENVMAGVFRFDFDGRFLSANRAMCQLLDYQEATSVAGLGDARDMFARAGGFGRLVARLREGGLVSDYEVQLRSRSGRKLVGLLSCYRVHDDETGTPLLEGTVIDITERKRHEMELSRLSQIDRLTGLANRYQFNESLQAALTRARAKAERVAVMFIDLDRFKEINDTLGHEAGDRLLCEVAERLSATLRGSDVVARLGGDEFGVLIDSVHTAADLGMIAGKLNEAVRPTVELGAENVRIDCSIGIAVSPESGTDAATLMKSADLAMYKAKSEGKGTYRFYSEKIHAVAVREMELKRSLRNAAANLDFNLVYQPKLDIATGRILALEALLRWSDPRLGSVSPDEFVPLLEKTGDIGSVGAWVMAEATRELASWRTLPGCEDLTVAVNLSVRQLLQRRLLEDVHHALLDSGLDAGALELEVTETALMEDREQCVAILEELRRLGVRITVDDFGTGFASLQYLTLMPIDGLKVDRSFVRNLKTSRTDRAIVRATVALAGSLDLRVTAEGVENPEQARLVQELGCDAVQGFLYYRGMPADEVPRALLGITSISQRAKL